MLCTGDDGPRVIYTDLSPSELSLAWYQSAHIRRGHFYKEPLIMNTPEMADAVPNEVQVPVSPDSEHSTSSTSSDVEKVNPANDSSVSLVIHTIGADQIQQMIEHAKEEIAAAVPSSLPVEAHIRHAEELHRIAFAIERGAKFMVHEIADLVQKVV